MPEPDTWLAGRLGTGGGAIAPASNADNLARGLRGVPLLVLVDVAEGAVETRDVFVDMVSRSDELPEFLRIAAPSSRTDVEPLRSEAWKSNFFLSGRGSGGTSALLRVKPSRPLSLRACGRQQD